jgi:NAD(P)-dependent dehydrogenase (short-subunit alcohol dehydrogenase family)
MKFADKQVVITGGTGEIGLVMAREFVDQGAEVTVLDKVILASAEHAIATMGARFVAVDVTEPDSVASAIAALPEIDIAIANAGVHRGARLLDLSFDHWKLQIDVNLTGVFLFVQAAARKMVARGCGGAILITGSWVQNVPSVDNTAYCVSKSGAAMLARCAALELGEHQIRVNVVAPGIVNAGMARRQIEIDPVFARKATTGLPLGRLQTAEQIAKAAAFLCCDDAASITGATLLVDGGASLFKYE